MQEPVLNSAVIGGCLALLRKYHCITKTELANLLGVSVKRISNMESGRVPVRFDMVCSLAEAYNMSLTDVFHFVTVCPLVTIDTDPADFENSPYVFWLTHNARMRGKIK